MSEPKKLNFKAVDMALPKAIVRPINERADEKEKVEKVARAEGFTSRQPSKPKLDGRSLRKTDRNFQLNIGVSAATKDKFWELASQSGAASGGDFLQHLLTHYEVR